MHLISFCLLVSLAALQTPDEFPAETGPVAYTYTRNTTDTTCAAHPSEQWRVDAVVNHPYVHATALLGVQINELLTCASHVLGIVLVAMNLGRIAEIRRRWAEYAVTAGILEISILVGFGVRDFYALLLVFTLNIGLQASGGLTLDELRARLTNNNPFYQQQRGVLLAQSFVFLGVQIAYTMTTALEAGTPGLGGTLVASSVLYACFYASFGVLQTLSHCVPEFDARYDTPVFFILLSVTSKVCLSWHAVHVQQQVQRQITGTSEQSVGAAVPWLYGASAVLITLYTVWRSFVTPTPSATLSGRKPRFTYTALQRK